MGGLLILKTLYSICRDIPLREGVKRIGKVLHLVFLIPLRTFFDEIVYEEEKSQGRTHRVSAPTGILA